MSKRTIGFVDTIPSEPGEASIEEIVGPICGWYLACYTVEAADGYFGYAKLCMQRPPSIWQAQARRKVAAGPYGSPEAAITAVVDETTLLLSRRREQELSLRNPWSNTVPG